MTSSRISGRLGALAVVALLCAGPAVAQPRDKYAQAKEAYERGTKAYTLGRFDQAIEAFSSAYELDPSPILLYNIAQSHWKSGNNERAVFFYRRYLEAEPKAENRERIEARIRELEKKGAGSEEGKTGLAPRASGLGPDGGVAPPVVRAPEAPVAPAVKQPEAPVALLDRRVPPDEARPVYRRAWFWGVVGGVVAAGVVTAVLLGRSGGEVSCGTNCTWHPVGEP
jgi:tetratricopeptide (TPR) repeat protein